MERQLAIPLAATWLLISFSACQQGPSVTSAALPAGATTDQTMRQAAAVFVENIWKPIV